MKKAIKCQSCGSILKESEIFKFEEYENFVVSLITGVKKKTKFICRNCMEER